MDGAPGLVGDEGRRVSRTALRSPTKSDVGVDVFVDLGGSISMWIFLAWGA